MWAKSTAPSRVVVTLGMLTALTMAFALGQISAAAAFGHPNWKGMTVGAIALAVALITPVRFVWGRLAPTVRQS